MRPKKTKMFYFFCCGHERGGSYVVRYGWDFTCTDCGNRYRSLWNQIRGLFRELPKGPTKGEISEEEFIKQIADQMPTDYWKKREEMAI